MNRRFLRSEKARPDPSTSRAERKHSGKPATVSYPARGDDGNGIDYVDDTWNKRQGRDCSAHMSARLPALRDNYVGTGSRCASRLIRAGDGNEHDRAFVMRLLHQAGRIAPEERDDGRACVHRNG
jgi:hypothetical protein